MRAVKGGGEGTAAIREGDIIVLMGNGPSGTGMQETAQITTALKYLPWGKHVSLITDGRFSGLSTGACIGHVGPEALDGGPIGRVRDGDIIEIAIDRASLTGSIDVVAIGGEAHTKEACASVLADRPPHPRLAPHPLLPADTRLWAALQRVSGGTWAGCVYDVDRIIDALDASASTRAATVPA
jgi:dihydroxyacid dehydratase/phosphogluconate dehydratase